MLKRIITVCLIVVALLAFTGLSANAQDSATPEEVYDLIIKAHDVLKQLGAEGLDAFKDPKGEFTYKDTYVVVEDCEKMILAAHPNPKLVGLDVSDHLDKNPDPTKRVNPDKAVCALKDNPNGGWVEYYWEKLGENKPSRKISFAIGVDGTPWVVLAGIYNDNVTVEELNSKLP